MKLLLLKDVDGVGEKDQIADVKDGYARNYLIPRGLAVPATEGIVADAARRHKAKQQSKERERTEAMKLATKLNGARVELAASSSPEGRLFGSVTASTVAQTIKTQLNSDIDKRRIQLAQPIKSLGEHEAKIKLGSGQTATVTVVVRPEEGDS